MTTVWLAARLHRAHCLTARLSPRYVEARAVEEELGRRLVARADARRIGEERAI